MASDVLNKYKLLDENDEVDVSRLIMVLVEFDKLQDNYTSLVEVMTSGMMSGYNFPPEVVLSVYKHNKEASEAELKKSYCSDVIHIIHESFPNVSTDGVDELITEYFS